jgi:hypothetical protein
VCLRVAVRGVYFNPSLPDGAFRQYAVLPLDLFADAAAVELSAAATTAGTAPPIARDAPVAVSEAGAGSNTRSSGGSVGQRRKAAEAAAAVAEAAEAAEAEAASTAATAGITVADAAPQPEPLQLAEVRELLSGLPLLASLTPRGISLEVVEVAAAEGLVRLRYTGPPKVRLAVEVKIRTALLEAEPRVRRVEYA